MVQIDGLYGISVKILADSINEAGNRLVTYELVYQRMIHAELLTHGMLVRNAASSRAIPFEKMVKQLTARPVRFGQANKGMQDKGEDYDALIQGEYITEDEDYQYHTHDQAWELAKEDAIMWSKRFYEAGYHKQVYNRLTEPFQMMKTVLSGTEFVNFFWLRNHGAADPTLHELARCMQEARDQSVPTLLKPGQWHLPYIFVDWFSYDGGEDQPHYYLSENDHISNDLSLEDAIKVSAARCAAVSFRNEGYDLAKTLE
ncbi:MAG TPA: hypothetical protein VIR31_03690, partial [Nitrososphaeraceae archaeon]